MTYITSNTDPAFRFEDLARFAFDNCSKYGDPWGYAAQEVYSNFIPNIELKGKRILSTILNKLIYDNRNNQVCEKLKQVENSIWNANSQNDAIDIINRTIELLQE